MMEEKNRRGGARKGAGRKPGVYGPEGPYTHRQVSLPEEEWKVIDEAAQRLGLTRSSLMREAVKSYLASLEDKKF